MNWRLLGESFVTLSVIMDPPGTVPVFLALTGSLSTAERRRAAWQAVAVAFGVIVVFALFGRVILDYLGITLPALQAAGGLLLLLVSLQLLTGQLDETPRPAADNIAMVPLGTPLLAGPGAIVATMVFVQDAEDATDFAAVGLAIVAVHLVLWAVLGFSVVIRRVLKDSGIQLLSRIAGLLLAAIAVQLVAEAVRAYVSGA
ncbi:MAG: NAAT family transporter [Jiangellaceae bacterium]|nr:NAAT family transporter [Jiangellaceae bacterium]